MYNYNYLIGLLGGLGGLAILFFVLLPLVISIAILVWLHNISLNTHGTYDILVEELEGLNTNVNKILILLQKSQLEGESSKPK
jgi:hypothetical protein